MDHYVEPLPDEIAKMILGVSYVANCNYQIVHRDVEVFQEFCKEED